MKYSLRGVLRVGFVAAWLVLLTSSASAVITRQVINSSFSTPVYVTAPPGDGNRLFVVERAGLIRIIDLNTNNVLSPPFLDVDESPNTDVNDDGEGGLLSMAFHPEYALNGYFFVFYTTSLQGTGFTTRVSRFTVTSDPNIADPDSEEIFFELDDPFENHNGGTLAFRPGDEDYHLFVALGDSGSSCDPSELAQNINSKFGKFLRVDVDAGPSGDLQNPNAPASNPFVGVSGDDLIWSIGWRNPFRWSFDRLTGDMYVGDVGQVTREEIDFEAADADGGLNYGWDAREGLIQSPCTDRAPTLSGMINPITDYDHNGEGASVTGGNIYRGGQFATLYGRYFFADFETGQVWSCIPEATSITDLEEHTNILNPNGANIVAFGEDGRARLYIVEFGGTVARITDPASALADADGDGVFDGYESNDGIFNSPTDTGTNPNNADSDGDGFIDGLEIADGTNPNNAASNLPRADVYVMLGAPAPRMGTIEHPAATLGGAAPVAEAGGTVHFLNAGNSDEQPTIDNPVTVIVENGTVLIGVP